ncbi:glycosyltransferase family 2 protein [Nodularia sp. LEGE 06071]|uniref:glycosyltransferase family 2 protein n=1 Tax=unclassified Nodularia (in: cyanobacteria) TaxID=2656917 RepID=UPI001D1121A1|nr:MULTISPECIES: glycosyltransferase [unclassified Nodularia (in: cyanobacteria)]
MKPDVSVIIPAYNTETYIAQSIESVLLQTLNNIEIIVVMENRVCIWGYQSPCSNEIF